MVDGPPDPLPPATFDRLARRIARVSPRYAREAGSLLGQVEAVDQAVYAAVAATPTPSLDRLLRRVTRVADNGVLWVGVAAGLAVVGGRRGRRAALEGLASQAAASVVANLVIKPVAVRARPDRDEAALVADRHVRMPGSRSFPSGHTASAFAFAAGATRELPVLAPALYSLAGLVGWSRVHTGVHFPLDVAIGATVGAVTGEVVGAVTGRVVRRPR